MRLKFLNQMIEELAGASSVPIISLLEGKKDVNEFLIAKKMDMTINQIRNILYKLSAEGLVSFVRKKDKKKGWYIYFWTLDSLKSLAKIEASLIGEIEKLRELLKVRETKEFYICKTCNIEVVHEKALEEDFTCEECASPYEISDNSKIIRELSTRINRKLRELNFVREEIRLLGEENLRKKEKEKNKLAKEKEKLKDEKSSKKTTTKKSPAKKVTKKKVVKKTSTKKPVKKPTKKKVVKKPIKKRN